MKYKVNEIFFSMQGEGFNQGKEVVFLRLSGCNLSCTWCDTLHHSYNKMSISSIVESILAYNCKSIIITGGEPFIHDLYPLLSVLKTFDFWIGIESNGTISPPEETLALIDYISISPKSEFVLTKVDEVRIVNNDITVDFLANLESKIDAFNYYLSPLDLGGNMNISETMALLGKVNDRNGKNWRISLQLHKLAGIQ